MGCDIHAWGERLENGKYETNNLLTAFDCRSYGLFGFLANVRNYSMIPSISEPKGIPSDASEYYLRKVHSWNLDGHSHSYLTLQELLDFPYDTTFEDRRVTREIAPNLFDGAYVVDPSEGKITTIREFLGEWYFAELIRLKDLGVVRIVFFFDN